MKKILIIFCLFTSSLFAQKWNPFTQVNDPQGWNKHEAAGFGSGVLVGEYVHYITGNNGLTAKYTIGVPVMLGAGKEASDYYLHTGVATWGDFLHTFYGGVAAFLVVGIHLSIQQQNRQEKELKRIQSLETKPEYNPDVFLPHEQQ